MTTQTAHDGSRLERILAYIVAGVVGLSVIAFICVLVGTATGVGANDGFSQGIWPAIITLPLFGLPLGFLVTLTLIVVVAVRRRREAQRDGR